MCTWPQAEKEAGPPTKEEEVGTWFSNPGADDSKPQVSTGVGKYLSAKQLGNLGPVAAESEAATVPPPAKKAKQANYGNFDAW